jgi:hypothetical protein
VIDAQTRFLRAVAIARQMVSLLCHDFCPFMAGHFFWSKKMVSISTTLIPLAFSIFAGVSLYAGLVRPAFVYAGFLN